MEQRKESLEMKALAEEVIDAFPEFSFIRDEGIEIIYLESDREKKSRGRTVYGECEKIPDKYQWAIPVDFTVTFYAENVSGFTEDQKRILMEHELRHIGGRDGKFFVKPHDIEDFEVILKKYGMDWAKADNKQILEAPAAEEKEVPAADKVIEKRIPK